MKASLTIADIYAGEGVEDGFYSTCLVEILRLNFDKGWWNYLSNKLRYCLGEGTQPLGPLCPRQSFTLLFRFALYPVKKYICVILNTIRIKLICANLKAVLLWEGLEFISWQKQGQVICRWWLTTITAHKAQHPLRKTNFIFTNAVVESAVLS